MNFRHKLGITDKDSATLRIESESFRDANPTSPTLERQAVLSKIHTIAACISCSRLSAGPVYVDMSSPFHQERSRYMEQSPN